jgi:hypothetical protein
VSGKWKSLKNNGISLCVNPLCWTYKARNNTSNSDVRAAHCIAIAGVSRLLTGHTLAGFAQTGCYDTGHHQLLHYDSSVPGLLSLKRLFHSMDLITLFYGRCSVNHHSHGNTVVVFWQLAQLNDEKKRWPFLGLKCA